MGNPTVRVRLANLVPDGYCFWPAVVVEWLL
jgi:hypothetical protein